MNEGAAWGHRLPLPRIPVVALVEIPTAAPGGASSTGSKEACLRRFGEWWGPDELLDVLTEVNPSVAEMLGTHGEIDDAGRLSEILYTCVGPHFLRNVDGDPARRQRFVERILRAAAARGDIEESDIFDAAWKIHHRRFRSLGEVAEARISDRWCMQLAQKLGLPPSAAKKERVQRPPPTEVVEPHSQLNPLYDYQYTAGLLVRGMLEGTRSDKDGRPIKRRLIAVPTGSGKTRMLVETLVEWLNDGKPSGNAQQADSKFILWVAQTEELCEQAVGSFREVFEALGKRGTTLRLHRFWGQGGSLPSMEMSDLLDERGVIVATMQSLDKVLKKDPGQLDRLARLTSCIVVDEAHHSMASSYTSVLRQMHFNWNNRKKEMSELGIVLIGLTATPFRGTGDDEERENLKRRYGDVVYPDIPYYSGGGAGGNESPHALIDCQPSAYVGDPVRILGERSYDRDGYIRDDGYLWTIERTGRFIDMYRSPAEAEAEAGGGSEARRIDGQKNIVVQLDDPGEYKITLTVTDNEGDTGTASAYLRIRDPPAGAGRDQDGAAAPERQKRLYHRLIKRKILCDVYHRVLPSGDIHLTVRDIDHVRQFGEFGLDTIKEIGNIPARNRLILDKIYEMSRRHGRKKILFFGCSVEHSRLIAVLLKALHGMKTAYIDSKTDADSRAAAIEQFRSGDLEVLCNYGVLTAGFDAPNIDCVFVGRPVRSTLLYTQMIGRGMRGTRSGGTKDVVIIDIDDNFQLGYGQDESIEEVGWKIYRQYWKRWAEDDGDGDGGRDGREVDRPRDKPDEGAIRGRAEPAAGAGAIRGGAEPAAEEGAARPSAADARTRTTLDDEFDYLRDKEYGHTPTTRQFRARAQPDAVNAAERMFGGYAGYLESRGLALRGDPDLEDRLYEAYFALYQKKRAQPSRADLDRDGEFAAEDYAECFGSYDFFQGVADEITGRMSCLDTTVTKAALFRDYRRMRRDLGRAPHFGEARRMSGLGIEYYLGLFGTMAEFASAEEYDRTMVLQGLESDYRKLAGILGAAPDADQMAQRAPLSIGLLRSLYPDLDAAEAYRAFLENAGIAGATAGEASAAGHESDDERHPAGGPPPT